MAGKYTKEEVLKKLKEITLKEGKRLTQDEIYYYDDLPVKSTMWKLFGGINNAYEMLDINFDELEENRQEPTFEPSNIKEIFGIGVEL